MGHCRYTRCKMDFNLLYANVYRNEKRAENKWNISKNSNQKPTTAGTFWLHNLQSGLQQQFQYNNNNNNGESERERSQSIEQITKPKLLIVYMFYNWMGRGRIKEFGFSHIGIQIKKFYSRSKHFILLSLLQVTSLLSTQEISISEHSIEMESTQCAVFYI